MAENLLTRNELAKQLKVHPETVSRLKKQGLITPSISINNRDRFSLKKVKEALSNHTK